MQRNDDEKSLKISIVLTSIFFGVEIIGGLISGSLSLLGDAGHMFRDVFALFLSLSAINLSKKLPSKTKTFGYHRIEIFSAFLNGILLIGISTWILGQAYQRFYAPRPIKSTTMFSVAMMGLAVNLYVAFKLHGSHDINIRSAFFHVLADTISSGAVILASILIFFTGKTIFDPILGIGIAIVIILSGFKIVKDSITILLEFKPRNIDFDQVIKDIEQVKGVQGVHNVHLWSLCSNINVIDAHIYTTESDILEIEGIKREIKIKLEKYKIKHATLEFECEECLMKPKIKNIEH